MILIYIFAFIGYLTTGNFFLNSLERNYIIDALEEVPSWIVYVIGFILYVILWPLSLLVNVMLSWLSKDCIEEQNDDDYDVVIHN